MASVTFDFVSIAPASDLSDTLFLGNAEYVSLSVERSKRGEVRTYAGGVTRAITKPGSFSVAKIKAEHASKTKKESLQDLAGELVYFRSSRGHAFFGAFFSVPAEEERGSQEYAAVDITITEVNSATLEV